VSSLYRWFIKGWWAMYPGVCIWRYLNREANARLSMDCRSGQREALGWPARAANARFGWTAGRANTRLSVGLPEGRTRGSRLTEGQHEDPKEMRGDYDELVDAANNIEAASTNTTTPALASRVLGRNRDNLWALEDIHEICAPVDDMGEHIVFLGSRAHITGGYK